MVTVDNESRTVKFDDLGVTMRTLLWHAANGAKVVGSRVWNLEYKGVRIGKVQVSDDNSNATGDDRRRASKAKRVPAITGGKSAPKYSVRSDPQW